MQIKIAHLYHDLMNLYGESGNVKALVRQLENQEIEVKLDKLTINDEINFSKYDVFIMGAGTENNQLIALRNFLQYKSEIETAITKGKVFLFTGNAIDLLGKNISDQEGNLHKALGIFNFNVEQLKERLVSECIFSSTVSSKNIIGFQNRGSVIEYDENNLFEVIRGYGNTDNLKKEGIHYKNLFATSLIGPLLVRNPDFMEYFVGQVIFSKNKNFVLKDFDLSIDKLAYNSFMEKHYPGYIK